MNFLIDEALIYILS